MNRKAKKSAELTFATVLFSIWSKPFTIKFSDVQYKADQKAHGWNVMGFNHCSPRCTVNSVAQCHIDRMSGLQAGDSERLLRSELIFVLFVE